MVNNIVLELRDISFEVKKNFRYQILKNINLQIYQSEIFGLTGESGSGKTTLAKIISGLESQTTGKKFFRGIEFNGIHPEHKIQFLFQNYSATHDPHQKINTAFDEILKLIGFQKEELFKQKKYVLNLVGLSDEVLNMYPSQLSGGQLQRLALAKLLLLNPSLLILDEPFASQDVVSINNLIKIFIQINHQLKTTFLVISHEIPYLLKFCDRIGVMKDGELKDILIIKKTDRKVEIQNISSDYTKFLLQTFEINL